MAGAVFAVVLVPGATAAGRADCGPTPYDCAVVHVERRDFAAAIDALEPLVAGSPGDLRALNLLGIALTSAGRLEEGSARFRDALRIDPDFYPARKNLGINEFNRGRLSEAQRELEAVLKRVPADEVTHLHLAEIHFQKERLRSAAGHYARAGGRVYQSPAWTLHYATTLAEEGQAGKAAAVLDRLPARDAAGRFEGAMALARAGAPAEAARLFGTARAGYREPYVAGYNQALMLVEAGDHEAAIRVVEELLAGGRSVPAAPPPPEDAARRAELQNLASRAYLGAGRIQEAYDALRSATRLAPEVEENYVDLALIALDHENLDLGVEIVDVGLHHRPGSSILHLQRGVLLAMKAEWSRAEEAFEAARRLAPEAPAPLAALAMIWMQTGRTGTAVEVLREEAGLRRNDHVVPYIFAVALMRSGLDPAEPGAEEAVAALKASVAANESFAPARTELGRLLLRRDDTEGAIRELERAVALDPESTAAVYNLAQAYRKKGDRARAGELLARVSRGQEPGDDPDQELRRAVVRIVREGAPPKPAGPR